MRGPLSLAVGVSLIATSLPMTTEAQAPKVVESSRSVTVGRLMPTISREAARLAAEGVTASAVDVVAKSAATGKSDWRRVRDLEGEKITLTIHGSQPVMRYVVRHTVNQSGLTVLNLTDPAIPAAAAGVLADAAWWHPKYFEQARQGGDIRVNKHVRLGARSVFMDGQSVGLTGARKPRRARI